MASEGLIYSAGRGWLPQPAGRSTLPEPGPPAGDPGESPAADLVACAVGLVPAPARSRRRSAIHSVHVVPAVEEARKGSPVNLKGRWKEISRMLRGSGAVFMDRDREAPPLIGELARRGLEGPAFTRSLIPALRGAVKIPRGTLPEDAARLVGCALPDLLDGAAAAEGIARCLAAAERMRRSRDAGARAGDPPVEHPVLNRALLSTVPDEPGTYRFLDAGGKLIYVGKSANLRRRIGEYVRGRPGGSRGRKPRLVMSELSRVAEVIIEPAGSDLEAILREADLIRRKRPEANVQRKVHRRRSLSGSRGLRCYLLPAGGGSGIVALMMRDGRYAGSFRIGPRGGGLAAAREVIREALEAGGSERGLELADPADPATELVRSWLAREGEAVSRVELEGCSGAEEAVRLLKRAAGDPERIPGETVHYLPEGAGSGRWMKNDARKRFR